MIPLGKSLKMSYNKVKWNESRKNIFKKLYTLGQFLLLADISHKNDIVDTKI